MKRSIQCVFKQFLKGALHGTKCGILALICAVFTPLSASKAMSADSSASFLRIPVSARAVGLGAGYLGVANDVLAPLDNSAGLAHLKDKQMGFSYATHLLGSNLGFFGYGHPTNFGVFGVNYLTFRSADIEGRDRDGSKISDYGVEDRSISITFARSFQLNEKGSQAAPLRIGSSIKYIQSTIASYSGSAFAMDLGAQYRWENRWKPMELGVSLKNFGSKITYLNKKESLPLNLAMGVQVQAVSYLSLGAGFSNYLAENRTEITSGVEFAPLGKVMQFRGNYGVSRSQQSISPILSGGFGVTIRSFKLDYAFAPIGELGAAQKINLTFKFGNTLMPKETPEDETISYNYSRPERRSK